MTGRIHSYQSLGTLDGPGIRFVIFLQGCPLRCAFCHNPDTWNMTEGQEVDLNTVTAKILKYQNYFGSKGGVTISGGEPLLQAEFVTAVFAFCRQQGIHTALDTSGCRMNPKVRKLLAFTDLCLLDHKMASEEDYVLYTGGSMNQVLYFLETLQQQKIPVWLRRTMIPEINDSKEALTALARLKTKFSCVEQIELLPFHKMCSTKYDALGIPFPFGDRKEPTAEQMEQYKQWLQKEINQTL